MRRTTCLSISTPNVFELNQGNPRATEASIAAFELNYGANEWLRGAFRPRLCSFVRREQSTVFASHQALVNTQAGRWPNAHSNLGDTARFEAKRPEADKESVSVGKIWRPSPRPCHNEELLFEGEILGDDSLCATGPRSFAMVVSRSSNGISMSFIPAQVRAS